MSSSKNADPFAKWVTTLSWPDKLIARLFPRFFKRYAPEEIQKQWAEHLNKKQKSRQ
jgi:hypothetical protein